MASSCPGVLVGQGEAKPARYCHWTCSGSCTNPPPGGMQFCMARPLIAVLRRWLFPFAVSAAAKVLPLGRDGARLGTSAALCGSC